MKVLFRYRPTGVENVRDDEAIATAVSLAWTGHAVVMFPTERLARLGPLRVAYGMPIEVGDLDGLPADEAARVATERLADAVRDLERRVA